MADYGTYASLSELKASLGIASSDTADDAEHRRVLERVSRFIDDYCGRHFYVKTATKTFTAEESDYLLLTGDLLSITTLKTDEDEDWDYDYSWAVTDYHLYPFNGFPKWKIMVKAQGDYTFPSQIEGVQIAGQWGYGDGESATPYADSGTATAEELDATETGVDVVDGTKVEVGNTILVESEQMYVTAVATNTLTVVRGVNGTTAATHATAKTVYVYQYPGPVIEACLIQAARIWKRKDAPFGVTGATEFGQASVIVRLDPDVRQLLSTYRWIAVT